MRKLADRRERCSGFTLIELLVVVAIIALLIGLLLPALGKARENGRLSLCLSNARQVNAAGFSYAASNQDVWCVVPIQEWTLSTPPERATLFSSFEYGGKTTSDYWRTYSAGVCFAAANEKPLNPYLYDDIPLDDGTPGAPRVELGMFRCPSDPGTYQRSFWTPNFEPNRSITAYDDVGTSYQMNVKWWYYYLEQGNYSTWDKPATHRLWQRTRRMFRVGNFLMPARFVWLHDQTFDYVVNTDNASIKGEHGGRNKGVAAFMDGHVVYQDIKPGEASFGNYTTILDNFNPWQ